MATPRISWDIGTGYDFFMSLYVLHNPEKAGLRGKWAAGVRSRIPAEERTILQQAQGFLFKTQHWLYRLPAPKDSATLLNALEALPAEDRLPALLYTPELPAELREILDDVMVRQSWSQADLEAIPPIWGPSGPIRFSKEVKAHLLEWSANRAGYGEQYLKALLTFYDVFFAEEEKRIQPALQTALAQARSLAKQLELPALLETLSQGIRFTGRFEVPELVLAPSFWSTPLVTEGWLSSTQQFILFGARPVNASLVPGEAVPDALFLALKALADPTRLRILRYLAAKPLTPVQLSRRLRLRAPTVVHHLQVLRLAGLVTITLGAEEKRLYTVRHEAVGTIWEILQDFLEPEETLSD